MTDATKYAGDPRAWDVIITGAAKHGAIIGLFPEYSHAERLEVMNAARENYPEIWAAVVARCRASATDPALAHYRRHEAGFNAAADEMAAQQDDKYLDDVFANLAARNDLRKLALAADAARNGEDILKSAAALLDFECAADPAAILALLDEIERLRAALRNTLNVHSADLCSECRDAIHAALDGSDSKPEVNHGHE